MTFAVVEHKDVIAVAACNETTSGYIEMTVVVVVVVVVECMKVTAEYNWVPSDYTWVTAVVESEQPVDAVEGMYIVPN